MPMGAGTNGEILWKSSGLKINPRKKKLTIIVDGKESIIPEIDLGTFSAINDCSATIMPPIKKEAII